MLENYKFTKMGSKLDKIKKELLSYSTKVGNDLESENKNMIELTTQNNLIRQQLDNVLSHSEDSSWESICKNFNLENPDNFFGRG